MTYYFVIWHTEAVWFGSSAHLNCTLTVLRGQLKVISILYMCKDFTSFCELRCLSLCLSSDWFSWLGVTGAAIISISCMWVANEVRKWGKEKCAVDACGVLFEIVSFRGCQVSAAMANKLLALDVVAMCHAYNHKAKPCSSDNYPWMRCKWHYSQWSNWLTQQHLLSYWCQYKFMCCYEYAKVKYLHLITGLHIGLIHDARQTAGYIKNHKCVNVWFFVYSRRSANGKITNPCKKSKEIKSGI